MATDDADDAAIIDAFEEGSGDGTPNGDSPASVGEYTWADFMIEHGYEDEVDTVYERIREEGANGSSESQPTRDDWERVSFDPESYLGFEPESIDEQLIEATATGAELDEQVADSPDEPQSDIAKDVYTWEDYKEEYYYDGDGDPPRDGSGDVIPFDPFDELGFDPDRTENALAFYDEMATDLYDTVDENTVDVNEELDEDAFFSTVEGHTTVTNRYDLEKAVPLEKKHHFEETERYWVNKPYAFVIIFHSRKENETKYYLIEPYLSPIETELREFISQKLKTAIKYTSDDVLVEDEDEGQEDYRGVVIERVMGRLLDRYDLYSKDTGGVMDSIVGAIIETFDLDPETFGDSRSGRLAKRLGWQGPESMVEGGLDGIEVRPEPVLLEEDSQTLNEYQVEKIKYLLKRDFVGFERIDGIKHDINVEDISCDGYNSPVFVYHTDYEQIISNIYHGEDELDDFVVKLAQRSGKGISKRQPQVDATLPDGSRSQLTLGAEVSDHGTNYTIRQFKDVPFTPIDLINWHTFSLEQMAYLWLCIENHKSLIFAGGTASGKTTSLNAVSLFIPSNAKIVSIEDTREVELPQRNWIASVTRPSFSEGDQGDIDEFDLLEAALRQRPDYIVMGEIRGEEGRTLFQVMSTGHTTYTTFHADTVGEVLKRFTTEPINVSKTLFTALDLVSIQTQTRVRGNKVRKSKSITEINHYDAENDEINVQDVYQWRAETDEFVEVGQSNTLDEIMFDRGWDYDRLQDELFKRRVIIAYLIRNGLNEYAQVAATIQAFINDPDTILALIANNSLEESLEDLREMESVHIDIDPEKEALVPRPDPTDEVYELTGEILEEAEERILGEYRDMEPSEEELVAALKSTGSEADVQADISEEERAELLEELKAAEETPPEGPGSELETTGPESEPASASDAGPDEAVAEDAGEDEGDFDGWDSPGVESTADQAETTNPAMPTDDALDEAATAAAAADDQDAVDEWETPDDESASEQTADTGTAPDERPAEGFDDTDPSMGEWDSDVDTSDDWDSGNGTTDGREEEDDWDEWETGDEAMEWGDDDVSWQSLQANERQRANSMKETIEKRWRSLQQESSQSFERPDELVEPEEGE